MSNVSPPFSTMYGNLLAQARDDYAWISRYASEVSVFLAGLLAIVGVLKLGTVVAPSNHASTKTQATDQVLERIRFVGGTT